MLRKIGKKPIPDVTATLGSFPLLAYVTGTLKRTAEQSFKVLIDRWGRRIVDLDFNGWQPPGWWYPERGHDFELLRLDNIVTDFRRAPLAARTL